MLSWRSSNVDEMVLATFVEKGPLLPKEETHWRVLSIISFIVVREALVGMEPYGKLFWRIFSGRVLLVGKPRRTASMGGFTLTAAQIIQFMKFDEMSETSINHGGHSSVGSAPRLGAVVRVAADHDGVVPGRPSKDSMVTDVVLDVADDGALRDPAEQKDVADGEHGAAAAIVFRVELVSKCNRFKLWGSPHVNNFLYS